MRKETPDDCVTTHRPARLVKGIVAFATLSLVALGAVPVSARHDHGAAAATSTGCTTTSPGSTTLSLKVNGFTRTVIVHVPKGSTGTTPLALVFNMHGSGSTALEQEEFTKMNVAANHDGFIVAYPQALIPDGIGFDWNIPGVPLIGGGTVPPKSANDVKFLTSLVGIMESKYCVNPKEVYATGFSGGARMTSQLACDDSGLFAAVAPVSGLRRPTPCPTTRAVPVISFHGSADPVDPFAGHGQKYWTYSVTTAAKDWSSQDHCTSVGPLAAGERRQVDDVRRVFEQRAGRALRDHRRRSRMARWTDAARCADRDPRATDRTSSAPTL